MKRLIYILLWWMPALAGLAQTNFDYFYMEAEKCRLAGDYSSAAELYSHCLDINPQAPEALYNLSLIQFYLRQDSLGTSMLRRATELDPGNPWYLESLASIYMNRRDIGQAVPVLEKMAAIQTRRSDILSQLAQIYKSEGETQKAIDALQRIELLEGKSAQLSVEKFALYMDLEEREKAFQELQSLCDEFPHDMNYRVIMGRQYQQAGEMERAWDAYQAVKQKEPDNPNLQLALMDYYEEAGDTASYARMRDSLLFSPSTPSDLRVALMKIYIDHSRRDTSLVKPMREAFDAVLAMPQEDAQLLSLKAAYQMYMKEGDDAVAQTMQQILEVDPANQVAMSHLLQYYAAKNDIPAIEDLCRRGVNAFPEELAFHYYLGVSLYQQQKLPEAAEVFRQGLRTRDESASPDLVSDMFAILGDLYHQQGAGQEAQAFEAYDSALVYKDDNISCLNNYAYYLSLRGERLDQAEEMSYRTIKAEPNNITYLDTYAWILFMKKNYTEARIYIDKVVNPEEPEDSILANPRLQGNVIEHAGDIYSQLGDAEQALRLWQLAVRKKDDTCTPVIGKKIKKKHYINPEQ